MQIYSQQHLMQLITLSNYSCNIQEFDNSHGIIQETGIDKHKIASQLHAELNKIKDLYTNKTIQYFHFKHYTVDSLLKFGIVVDETVLKSYMRKNMRKYDDERQFRF